MFSQGKKVAVVYYRAGYTPDHYHSEAEWSARLLIERSKAIKCPNIQYHLAGTKKVSKKTYLHLSMLLIYLIKFHL